MAAQLPPNPPESYLFPNGEWNDWIPATIPNPTAATFEDNVPDFLWNIRRVSPNYVAVGFILRANGPGMFSDRRYLYWEALDDNLEFIELNGQPNVGQDPIMTEVESFVSYSKYRFARFVEVAPSCTRFQVHLNQQGAGFGFHKDMARAYVPYAMNQADFNAAVAANVAAQTAALQVAYTNAQTQITQLQAQVSQLQQGNVNLQQLEQQGTILLPKRRTGTYTIKDFTVLNAIYRTGNPTVFNKRDLDFIDVQMLSVQQAVRKMYQVGVAKQNDLNTSAIFRRRSNRLEEYSATMEDDMVEYLFECVRIMNYCVDEIRFRQSFNLNTPTLLRIIEPKP